MKLREVGGGESHLDLGLVFDVLADVRGTLAVGHARAVGRLAVRTGVTAAPIVFRGLQPSLLSASGKSNGTRKTHLAKSTRRELLDECGEDMGELERRLVPLEEGGEVAIDEVRVVVEERRHAAKEDRN